MSTCFPLPVASLLCPFVELTPLIMSRRLAVQACSKVKIAVAAKFVVETVSSQGGSGGTPQLTTHLAERTLCESLATVVSSLCRTGRMDVGQPLAVGATPRASRAGHATKPIGMLPFRAEFTTSTPRRPETK